MRRVSAIPSEADNESWPFPVFSDAIMPRPWGAGAGQPAGGLWAARASTAQGLPDPWRRVGASSPRRAGASSSDGEATHG
jgi:hypothetical protein